MIVGVFVVYGILLYIEASLGYRSSGDRRTLIQGLVAGSLLMAAAAMVRYQVQVQVGASIGVGTTLAMLGNFAGRMTKSKKFMPAGLMLALSIMALALLSTLVLR